MYSSERVTPIPDEPPPARSGAREEPSVVGTQSIYRALSILRSVSCSKDGVTGPEVAASFGYSIPTAYRLLRVPRFTVGFVDVLENTPCPSVIGLANLGKTEVASVALEETDLEVRLQPRHVLAGHRG